LAGVVVTADGPVAEAVQQAAKRPFVNLAGRTDLKQLAAVLRCCAVHVCGDTGSAHLAAALGRPVITLIGPTDPERVGPYGQRENVLSHREACDAACSWHHCKFEAPRCLAAISVEEVLKQVLLLTRG
jgi:heptosyltransferase I